MAERPTIRTSRLLLTPFQLTDAPDVQRLAGDERVADTIPLIPHPYPDGAAEQWIASHDESFQQGRSIELAVRSGSSGELFGCVALHLRRQHESAELGYWIGVPYWGRGYATEAAEAMIGYGFRELSLNRIQAHCMVRNASSIRVLEKLRVTWEGTHRQAIRHRGRFEDIHMYAVLRSEFVVNPECEGTRA